MAIPAAPVDQYDSVDGVLHCQDFQQTLLSGPFQADHPVLVRQMEQVSHNVIDVGGGEFPSVHEGYHSPDSNGGGVRYLQLVLLQLFHISCQSSS